MACVKPDGSLSTVAGKVLAAFQAGASVAEAAKQAGVPVFRVKASLRELTGAGLVQVEGGQVQVTDEGRSKL